MEKPTKRKGFNFFRSYFDVYNELENNEDKVAFIDALLERQFLGIKPTNLTGMAKFAYVSQTNSIDSQVKGYEDKTGIILNPCEPPAKGGAYTPAEQVEEKVEVKEKEKEEKGRLKNISFYENLLLETTWLELTAMQSTNKFTVHQVKTRLKQFTDTINAKLDYKPNKKEFVGHFVSWLNQQENPNKPVKQVIS